jgi:hypothetical protein
MAGQIWFGTKDYMTWVPAPAINVDASKQGWSSQSNYLNGGAYVRKSTTSHKEYNFSWNMTTRERIRAVTDYADGLYGDVIYWADPFVMDTNMLPQYCAAPMQGIDDGPIMSGSTTRPTSIATPANQNGYPTTSAVYTVAAGDTKPSLWVPIPPGYTAWVGAHGQAGTGGTVVVTPTTGGSNLGTPVTLTLLSVADVNRVNYSTTSAGVQISLGGSGTITLSGIIVQVLPTGRTPALGGFISGQGHSGCTFASQPVLTQYSAVLGQDGLVGATAKLVETQAWL